MPELPDVEVYRQYINATSLHQKITGIVVKSDRVLSGISAQKLSATLKGFELDSTDRHGKYLFVCLDNGTSVMMHFGMTGDVKYFKGDDDVVYDQLRLDFDNGYHLAYISRRKLGKISFVSDIEEFIRSKKLGPDALSLDQDEFRERIGKSRGSVKSTLMNQKIIAGIGNVYSDEILFHSRLHPQAKVQKLGDRKMLVLFGNMRRVLQMAIKCRTQPEKFPRSYLIPFRRKKEKCPACTGEIKGIKVSGRTAYYCPACQKKV